MSCSLVWFLKTTFIWHYSRNDLVWVVCPIRIQSVSPLLSVTAHIRAEHWFCLSMGLMKYSIFATSMLSEIESAGAAIPSQTVTCWMRGKLSLCQIVCFVICCNQCIWAWRNKHSIWKVMIIRQENVCSQIISIGNTNHWLGEIETCRNLLEGCDLDWHRHSF